jgi:molybdenum cofactor biosynthesis protein B
VAEPDPSAPVADERRVPLGTRALVLTISDGVVAGTRRDDSGEALAARLERLGFTVEHGLAADDRDAIAVAIRSALDQHVLVVTTGGTGLTPRDVTPQATAGVLEYEVPGLAEAMRAAGRATTPMADLSRGLVGVARQRLILNVPGSPRAALESLGALEPVLRHALETLGGPFDHDVAAGARPDLPDPDVPGIAHQDRTGSDMTARGISREGMPDERLEESGSPSPPAPGDGADPWRDLPPDR